MSYIEDHIGQNIREVRKEKGLSQNELHQKTGISITALSGYENGNMPGLTTLAIIARGLGVSLDRLYYGDENRAFIDAEPDIALFPFYGQTVNIDMGFPPFLERNRQGCISMCAGLESKSNE